MLGFELLLKSYLLDGDQTLSGNRIVEFEILICDVRKIIGVEHIHRANELSVDDEGRDQVRSDVALIENPLFLLGHHAVACQGGFPVSKCPFCAGITAQVDMHYFVGKFASAPGPQADQFFLSALKPNATSLATHKLGDLVGGIAKNRQQII